MDYRGIEYQIVELATPHRWKWTVFLTKTKTWTGLSITRADAVLDAERAIDRALKRFGNASAGDLDESLYASK
jgi:hypothetical protein